MSALITNLIIFLKKKENLNPIQIKSSIHIPSIKPTFQCHLVHNNDISICIIIKFTLTQYHLNMYNSMYLNFMEKKINSL